jgi:hypothetical protein
VKERDYPVGHPAAADYKGEKYFPPDAPFAADYPRNHPARGGKNVSDLDTPDGRRAAHLKQAQDIAELIAVGAIPSDTEHEADAITDAATDEERAARWLISRGYSPAAAEAAVELAGARRILAKT